MTDLPSNDIRKRLGDLVHSILAENAIERTFAPDDQLVEIGLTSLDMVTLMLRVEAEFDIAIPQTEITPDNFRSVATVENLLLKIAGRAARAA